MPATMLGLIEMIFVFSTVLGWAVFELVRLRRLKRPPSPPERPDQGS